MEKQNNNKELGNTDLKDSVKLSPNIQKEIICQHCSYQWVTNSEMLFVTCPSCLKKTIVAKENSEVLK